MSDDLKARIEQAETKEPTMTDDQQPDESTQTESRPDRVEVPWWPNSEMMGGLARDIVMWRDMDRPTGSALHLHLKRLGREMPSWLSEIIPDVEHVPPKSAVAAAIYKAMIDAAPPTDT